mmetsp:Transcript_81548/g.243106  ORF Transcript_81548/g.243106 Transcript_81548/m.243106 type:complete len:393 (+) Transcript_81548:79-1257(+)
MIDFDDLEEAADARDDLDEAALAAVSAGPSKLNGAQEELSLDELLGRSARATAAESGAAAGATPAGDAGVDSGGPQQRSDRELHGASGPRGSAGGAAERGPDIWGGAGGEPDLASLHASWSSGPGGGAGQSSGSNPKAKRLSLCELSPSWSSPAPPSAEVPGCVEVRALDEAEVSRGLPTDTTAAEATSTREEISSGSSDEAEGAVAATRREEAAEPEKPQTAPAAAAAAEAPAHWPARPDEAHFRIFDAVLPMRLPREGMTPQEVMRIWQEDWGVAYARTLRFEAPKAPESSSRCWLNPREDVLPYSPAIVRLEGKAGILNALALSLRQHDERLRQRSGAEAARRRLSAQASGADFGPRLRPATAPKRRVGGAMGRGTPFARRQVSLRGED